jgi:hypothetical protein
MKTVFSPIKRDNVWSENLHVVATKGEPLCPLDID